LLLNFRRFLRPESIRLDLETRSRPEGDVPEGWDAEDPKNLRRVREQVLKELTDLLAAGGEVSNSTRLYREICERENKAVTAVGHGVALPHVRSLQVKTFIMAFGRSPEGLPFGAPDGESVHFFFAMGAPPYDDKTYLKVYRGLAKALLDPRVHEALHAATEPSHVLLVLNEVEI
jgi:PTS system fructose-specific IIC component